MKDPYDFIDWNPDHNSLSLLRHQINLHHSQWRVPNKKKLYCISHRQMLALYNLVTLLVLVTTIIIAMKQIANW